MSLSAVRDGIAAALSSIDGLHVHSYVPDNPSPPMAVVSPSRVTFDTAFGRGSDGYLIDVILIVSRASERSAQEVIDAYIDGAGPSSVKAAIEADRTLAGACASLRVTEVTNYGPLAVGETPYLSATLAVQVVTN